MAQDTFEAVCDRLSQAVDASQFERMRWDRTEAPMLARLIELLNTVLEVRPDFELLEEGATAIIKRYVIKVHGTRTIAVAMTLKGREVVVYGETIERSRYRMSDTSPVCADFDAVDEAWMTRALELIFSRVTD